MTVVHEDPGLRFWLEAVVSSGGLTEDAGDAALVVLPDALQAQLELPETLTVSADPEVAREDGAVLLAPGHPALDGMAARVLHTGDAGQAWLAWSQRTAPSAAKLLAKARETFHVDHGRLDAAGPVALCYAPFLRVGALVTYTASLDLRFQEREEVVVDATTGLAPEVGDRRAMDAQPLLDRPDTRHQPLAPDLPIALGGADALLRGRAAERQRALAGQAAGTRCDELARLDNYYEGVLATIASRRETADADRRRLLDDQAHATRLEHQRRRQEVEEQYRPSHELRPVRLHLLQVPAARLALRVQRGARSFPLACTWLLPAAGFAPLRCPGCGAAEPLVAGRERLGCVACEAPRPALAVAPAAVEAPPADAAPPRPAEPPAPAAPPDATTAPPDATAVTRGASPRQAVPAASVHRPARPADSARKPVASAPATARPTPTSARTNARTSARKVAAGGDRLALDFWQAVAVGERWPRKKVAADSPLQTVYRLWGAFGPAVAVGLPPATSPEHVTAGTAAPEPGLPHATTGFVTAGGARYPYTLRWELTAGKPRVVEVVPFPAARTPSLPPVSRADPGARPWLGQQATAPRSTALNDPVVAQLWRVEPATAGLPATVRAVTAWLRLGWHDEAMPSAPVMAAALASVLSPWSGRQRTRAAAAAEHGADVAAVQRAVRVLKQRLAPSLLRPW